MASWLRQPDRSLYINYVFYIFLFTDEEGSEILGSQDINLICQRCMLQHSQGYLKEFAKTGYIMMTQYLRMNIDNTSEERQHRYGSRNLENLNDVEMA